MYTPLVNPDQNCVLENGEHFQPLVTFADPAGGRYQVTVDDKYIIFYMINAAGAYVAAKWIPPEVVIGAAAIIKDLHERRYEHVKVAINRALMTIGRMGISVTKIIIPHEYEKYIWSSHIVDTANRKIYGIPYQTANQNYVTAFPEDDRVEPVNIDIND
jgi:hypothetical protein